MSTYWIYVLFKLLYTLDICLPPGRLLGQGPAGAAAGGGRAAAGLPACDYDIIQYTIAMTCYNITII